MLTAFVSDIHANLEALESVLADIEQRSPDRVVCLGDVVNYGPDPAACLRGVRSLDLCLMGNHEEAVLGEPIGFNPVAAEAARWTRSVLLPGFLSDGSKSANWAFVSTLRLKHQEDGMLLVHASPRAPTTEYLLPSDADPILGEPSPKLVECFGLVDRVCFVGHTHLPGVFAGPAAFLSAGQLHNEFRVRKGEKAIINVGSVGQPRDRNPKACYATFDGELVQYHRLAYNVRKTRDKVLAAKGLPDWCGLRLLKGE